nr:uncharacterized protein LOC124213837 [Neodiprion pinetum]
MYPTKRYKNMIQTESEFIFCSDQVLCQVTRMHCSNVIYLCSHQSAVLQILSTRGVRVALRPLCDANIEISGCHVSVRNGVNQKLIHIIGASGYLSTGHALPTANYGLKDLVVHSLIMES